MKDIRIWSFSAVAALLVAGFALTTTGCGSGSTQIRFVHAGDGAGSVDILIDSKTVSTNLGYANNSNYFKVSSGSHTIEIRPTGTTSDLVNTKVTLASGSSSTGILQNLTGAALAIFTDDDTAPKSGQANLRIIHSAEAPGNLDIYIISPGQGITGLSPTIPNVTYSSATKYQGLNAGSYEIVATYAGTQGIFADTIASPLNLANGQIRTMVILDNLGNAPYLILSDKN